MSERINNIFSDTGNEEMKAIYKQILAGREEGLRPRILDSYIRKVMSTYHMGFADAWSFTEELFWDEVGKRFFEKESKV